MKKVGKKVWGILVALLLMIPTMTGLVSSTQTHAASDSATIVLHKKKMTTLPDPTIQNTGKEMSEFDQYDGLGDVEFKIYDVTEAYYAARAAGKSVEEAQAAVKGLTTGTAIDTKVTDSNGDLTFAGLPKKSGNHDAVYVIAETPKDGVTSADNMVVAFPVYEMNADGTYTDNELDTIHLYPKNTVSVDGSMKLTKTGSDNEKLNGAQFVISKEEAGVTKYLSGVKDGLYVWSTDPNAAKKFITGNTYGIGDNDFTEVTGNEGELIVNGLEVGDYKVTETKAPDNAAMIDGETVNDFTVTKDNNSDKPVLVDVKNDTDVNLDKIVDGETHNVGDLIKYTITVKIPEGIANTKNDVYTKFNLLDTHDDSLTYVKGDANESLKVGNNAIGYTITNESATGFTVVPTLSDLQKYAGQTLTFTYYMKLNEKATPDTKYTNKANLDTDPGFNVTPPTTEVRTGGKKFVKVDSNFDSNNTLAGAEFIVKNADGKYMIQDKTTNAVTWGDESAATVFTTEKDGLVDIHGLKDGDYTLIETKAPEGYVLPSNPETGFTIEEGTYTQTEVKNIPNTKKGSLPSTGGKGIVAFVIVGLVAIAGAITYFVRSRKHAEI